MQKLIEATETKALNAAHGGEWFEFKRLKAIIANAFLSDDPRMSWPAEEALTRLQDVEAEMEEIQFA